jgi:hypothetical protein
MLARRGINKKHIHSNRKLHTAPIDQKKPTTAQIPAFADIASFKSDFSESCANFD